MKKRIIIIILVVISFFSYSCVDEKPDYCKYVNPFIGTGAHGHTYPGAQLPFGMVQLSPDTRNDDSWDGCGGYHYSDSSIIGFSHTHLSGTGVSDYGDVLFLPFTGDIVLNSGTSVDPDSGYRSRFSHDSEVASPGHYSVYLDDYKVKVGLTASVRTGFHNYTYEDSYNSKILIDLTHRDPVMESFITKVSDNEIEGYRRSKFWAGDQKVFFVARFSETITKFNLFGNNIIVEGANSLSGVSVKSVLEFGNVSNVKAKVAISAVDIDGARANLDDEIDGWNFQKCVDQARATWNQHLSKLEVEGGTNRERRNFYTAFYHSLLTPNVFSDVDGRYRGMDDKIHKSKNGEHYTVFSLWDTFRGLHPLLSITHPTETNGFVNSLIDKSKQFGEIPMWELAGNDTRCMIGYHGVSVIADAYAKGIRGYDLKDAFEACVKSANVNKRGIDLYRKFGFVPSNRSSQSVSKTLEYAYNDWCIAQLARASNNESEFDRYMARSKFYKNIFNKELTFMVGRDDSRNWDPEFDPMKVGYNYTEGNSFQYSLFVPHDIKNFKSLVGGDKGFNKWLDRLFNTNIEEELEEGTDVTGLIGNYAHGNEPSHHLAYLYNYSGQPWKTQERVRQIMDELYNDTPDGICGNEDCGQMSAWYVMSAMGFYSVCPGDPKYVIGSPIFDKITINHDSGKKFVITANNNSKHNKYIESAKLNGKEYSKTFFTHEDIINGGELSFNMSSTINTQTGVEEDSRPYTEITNNYVSIPFIEGSEREFIGVATVTLRCDDDNATMFYTLDGSQPSQKSIQYLKPLKISKSKTIKIKAFAKGLKPSVTVVEDIHVSESTVKSKLTKNGVNYKAYCGIYRSVYDWSNDKPVALGVTDNINLTSRPRDEWFGMEFTTYVKTPKDGKYTFWLNANDGCQLRIDGKELFESDGRKSHFLTQKYSLNLNKGFHKIEVRYFQCSDRKKLELLWQGPTFRKQEIKRISYFIK